jgi:cation diffusion facilitator family transporter
MTESQETPAGNSATPDTGVRVTVEGIAVNVVLFAGKTVVGFLSGSVALVADGVHSLSDLATDATVLAGIRLGARKADSNHPYGHGRYETLSGGLVAFVLLVFGVLAAWQAGAAFYAREHNYPGWPVLVVAGVSILAKEGIYRRTVRIARSAGSVALYANAWHHRSDALSSVAVLLGGVAGLLGWGHADQIAGILVGLMVAASGGKALFNVLHELSEGALCREEYAAIQKAIEGVSGVCGSHQLRTRRVGRETFLDVHVLVFPDLSIVEAHRVSMEVEEAVKGACDSPVNAMVHVEPDSPELEAHQREHD